MWFETKQYVCTCWGNKLFKHVLICHRTVHHPLYVRFMAVQGCCFTGHLQLFSPWARGKSIKILFLFIFSLGSFQSCDAMLEDAETQALMNRNFDLAILDGAYPECALGMVYQYKIPFMYMNTVGFYTGSLSISGNPGSYAVTPNFYTTFTDNMNLLERAANTGIQIFSDLMHQVSPIWI